MVCAQLVEFLFSSSEFSEHLSSFFSFYSFSCRASFSSALLCHSLTLPSLPAATAGGATRTGDPQQLLLTSTCDYLRSDPHSNPLLNLATPQNDQTLRATMFVYLLPLFSTRRPEYTRSNHTKSLDHVCKLHSQVVCKLHNQVSLPILICSRFTGLILTRLLGSMII